MKKILALAIALVMLSLCFVGCASKKDKFVVGITEFEPMDYKDADGNWIGFDADVAKLFAESLGKEVEFVLIDWSKKAFELENGNIDCVWNGMTLTDEVKATMSYSNSYFNNAQVVIVKADVADQYKTVDACKSLKFAVEVGSAAKDIAEENGFSYVEVKDQATALMEVAAGTSDACIIDFLMAVVTVGEGNSYPTLGAAASLTTEEYVVGFAKGSELTEKLNKFFTDNAAELKKIAEKYKVADYLIIK